jgi:hypothetical protein
VPIGDVHTHAVDAIGRLVSAVDPFCEDAGMSLRRRATAAVLSALILAALTGCPMEAEDTDDGDDFITLSVSR